MVVIKYRIVLREPAATERAATRQARQAALTAAQTDNAIQRQQTHAQALHVAVRLRRHVAALIEYLTALQEHAPTAHAVIHSNRPRVLRRLQHVRAIQYGHLRQFAQTEAAAQQPLT